MEQIPIEISMRMVKVAILSKLHLQIRLGGLQMRTAERKIPSEMVIMI